MTPARTAPRLAAAALAGWSALAAAAPGVAGGSGFDAAVGRHAPAESERVLEAELRDEAFRLWEAGGFGADRTERAAWVVRAPSGVAWRAWPWDRRYEQSRWLGPTPVNAFAIVHTHPAVVDPRPSDTDRATAARLGIAVYTVSRSGIWKAGPDGIVTRVGDERWWSGGEARKHGRESVSVGVALASGKNPPRSETAARAVRITE
jgi:proteasome lid subunit RPN8/RPN11